MEPVTNHWPEPGTNLQCGPGWLPPQIGCLVGRKMAAKEPVPARSPASRSRPALPPRRLPATRAGSSPQRAASRRQTASFLFFFFLKSEVLRGRVLPLPSVSSTRTPSLKTFFTPPPLHDTGPKGPGFLPLCCSQHTRPRAGFSTEIYKPLLQNVYMKHFITRRCCHSLGLESDFLFL